MPGPRYTPSRRSTQVPINNTKSSTSSYTTIAFLAVMLFFVLAFLINLFFVYVAIACMFWSFVVLLRFWCALLEVPLHAEAAFELWDRILILGMGLYFWVLLETFLLWVSIVTCGSSLIVPDVDECRSNSLREDA